MDNKHKFIISFYSGKTARKFYRFIRDAKSMDIFEYSSYDFGLTEDNYRHRDVEFTVYESKLASAAFFLDGLVEKMGGKSGERVVALAEAIRLEFLDYDDVDVRFCFTPEEN